ncbi:MAG: glutamate--cysteine ligase [Phycisphaerales bacterium]|nr:glutamate--cysteine ligase [Phycisphaerales bacterium]
MSYRLFEVFGVEIEYMIVDRETLSVRPIADQLLRMASGDDSGDHDAGAITWSNELTRHLVELKTTAPVPGFAGLAGHFQAQVSRINQMLASMPRPARLLGTGMHPWMDPDRELQLWPHENREIYQTYDRIFGCRGHGWANLQAVHLNLPFSGDDEFAALHAAVRLVLPVLPALAASTPYFNPSGAGPAATGLLDNRLEVYRTNSRRVPSAVGRVIPEPVFSRQAYEREILGRIYADLAPLDPEGVIRHEFANARGAIARFGRGSIEIRVLDAQECPAADVAVAAAVAAVVRAVARERFQDLDAQMRWAVDPLEKIFLATLKDADEAVIDNREYLQALGYRSGVRATAGELWRHLIETTVKPTWGMNAAFLAPLEVIASAGPLARRIVRAVGTAPGSAPDSAALREVYGRLADCLGEGRLFGAPAGG